MDIWFVLFFISLLLSATGLYYIRWLLKTIVTVNDDIFILNEKISDFCSHLDQIYEMEMFYGDQTLKSLIEHSKTLKEQIQSLDLVINDKVEGYEEEA